MKIRILVVFIASMAMSPVWAAVPSEAEGRTARAKASEAPPWKHKFGVRLGDALFRGAYMDVFYENQINGHWAVRFSVERMTFSESYYDPTPDYRPVNGMPLLRMSIDPDYQSVDIDRLGAAVDCVYYVFPWRRQNGTKLYLFAGLGLHKIDMKDEGSWSNDFVDRQTSDTVPTLSVGLGCHFSRFFGLEYKHYFSTLDSPFPEDVGKNWGQATLNFRFPVPGLPKGGWRERRR
jgi:hypothetical protein